MKLIKASDRLPVGTVPAILENQIGKLKIDETGGFFIGPGSLIGLPFSDKRLYSIIWVDEEKPHNGALPDALHSLADISDNRSRDKDRGITHRIAYMQLSDELRARAIRLQEPATVNNKKTS